MTKERMELLRSIQGTIDGLRSEGKSENDDPELQVLMDKFNSTITDDEKEFVRLFNLLF